MFDYISDLPILLLKMKFYKLKSVNIKLDNGISEKTYIRLNKIVCSNQNYR